MDKRNLMSLYENVVLEAYNQDFYNKQIKRLKIQVPGLSSEEIRNKIKRFGDLKSNWRTANEVSKKTKDAIAQGRLPRQQRRGAIIEPEVKGVEQTTLDSVLQIVAHAGVKSLNPGQLRAYKKFQEEQQRIKMLERVPLEIRNYNWKDLEAIVDQFPDPNERIALKKIAATGTGAEVIYEGNGLKIFFGSDGNECYILKRYIQKERREELEKYFGNKSSEEKEKEITGTYRWCVSQDPTGYSNLHFRYRTGTLGDGGNKSSYFVYDTNKPYGDRWHFFVIHVAEKGEVGPSGKRTPYLVTDAYNEGDVWMTWNEILKIEPRLKGLENLFNYIPLNEDEQIQLAVSNGANADSFKGFSSYKVKRAYIMNSPKNKIYKEDYLLLDPVLQQLYINQRIPVAQDPDKNSMLQKLMMPFADSRIDKDFLDLVNKAQEVGNASEDENNLDWLEALADNPTIKQSKQNQTFKRYKNLLYDIAIGVGSAYEAMQRKDVERRGFN